MATWSFVTIIGADGIGENERYCALHPVTGPLTVGRIKKPLSVSGAGAEENWQPLGVGMIDGDVIIFEYGFTYTDADGSADRVRVLRCPVSEGSGIEAAEGSIVSEFDYGSSEFPGDPYVGGMADGTGVVVSSNSGALHLASVYFDGGDPVFQTIESAPNNGDFQFARGISTLGGGLVEVFGGVYNSSEGYALAVGADGDFTLASSGTTPTEAHFFGSVRGISDFDDATSEYSVGRSSAAVVGFFTRTTGSTGFNCTERFERGPYAWHERTGASSGLFFATQDNAGKTAVIEYVISYSEPEETSIYFTLDTISEQDLGSPYSDALDLIGVSGSEAYLDSEGWAEASTAPAIPRFWTQLVQSIEVV